MMRSALAAASLALILGSGPSRADPFVIDDLLKLEQFGQTALSPQGSHIAFERMGSALDGGPYEYDALDLVLRTQVYVAAADGSVPPTGLARHPDGGGQVFGSWSPDGLRLLVYRLGDRAFQAGIANAATGDVRWLQGTPESAMWGRAAQWRDAEQLVLIQREAGDLPAMMRLGYDAGTRMQHLWGLTREGREPGRTVIGAGAFRDATPRPRESRLVLVSTTSGDQRTLSTGRFHDLELSPGGRFVAAARFTDDRSFDPSVPFLQGDFSTRRELTLVDLDTGAVWEPLPELDLSPNLMTWSPSGRRLLVWVRRDGQPWSEGRLAEIDPQQMTVTWTPLHGRQPALVQTGLRTEVICADWLGDRPVLYVQGDTRRDWVRLGPSDARVLTRDLASPSSSLVAISETHLAVQSGGEVWSVDQDGHALRLGQGRRVASGVTTALFSQGQRFQFNSPPRRDWVLIGEDELIRRRSLIDGAPFGEPLAGERVMAADERQAIVAETDGARETLHLADGASLARLNDHLADVVFASPEAVHHTAQDGSPLVSWLYRPAASGQQRPPLIIIPYPGGPARAPSPTEADIATNVQLIVAAGYAVLVPSLPRSEHRGEPAEDMGADILRAVDAAALTGGFDPDRLVLWGHSFGAYSAVAAATQSSRFSAVIAANGSYDLLSVWGQFALPQSLAPEDGLPVRSRAGWVETGQGGLGAPPWADPARYMRNSPVLSADRITAPVLLITADRDYVPPAQAQELFSALYRQQKDVVLVTYRGEGHVLSSPANIRDMYDVVWRWLDKVLARPSPALAADSESARLRHDEIHSKWRPM